MKIALIIGIVAVLLTLAAAWFLASFTVSGNRQTLEEAMNWQSEHYDTSFYSSLERTAYTVQGEDGYTLHAELLKNPDPTDRFIILSHGYTDNRYGSLKYAQMYLDLGFNCIIYDLRGHGENEKTITTYGLREAEDLLALVEDTRTRFPDLKILGLHGESLGAATTLTALKYHPSVDFAVADCGFSDLENVLREGYRNAHVPQFLVDVANLGMKMRYRFSLSDMRPIESLSDNTVPILFIHGAEDSFILPKNSQDMYERTQGIREIRLIPGAGHAESVLIAPDIYRETVEAFLHKVIPDF